MQAWVAVGDEENWVRGLENGIWGLQPHLENHWNRIDRGDVVLFYCKSPVKGFVGAGVVRGKFKQTSPYWKEEIEAGNVIWPFRFEFDVTHLVRLGRWRAERISNHAFNLPRMAGLNPATDADMILAVLDKLKFTVVEPIAADKKVSATIFEIGKIQRMVVESKYPVDGDYLDVIWKRTIRSVPTFAFAVDLHGNFDRSVGVLKHSHDLWNSRPFLVTEEQKISEAKKVTSGRYHEFAADLKVLTVGQVQELYNSKKTYFNLEEKYGLR